MSREKLPESWGKLFGNGSGWKKEEVQPYGNYYRSFEEQCAYYHSWRPSVWEIAAIRERLTVEEHNAD